jgi:hypothetical protein
MDIAVAALSGLLIVTGAVGLIVAGIYWGILRRPGPDHHLLMRLTLWTVVIVALGIVGLLLAGAMPDSTSFL